ncbi:MAG: hypothetical protein ACRENE_00625 [Polyangiaceae bacterium]
MVTRKPHALLAATGVLALVLPVAVGCGTDATGVEQCKQIEAARCRHAASSCPDIKLVPPYSTSGDSTDACVRFYDTACLHGLDVGVPASGDVDQCVSAIEHGSCAVVQTPESSPMCAWLVSASPATADASDGASSDTGASEASDGGAWSPD